jgi:cell wall assembly regulator SMI1
VPNTLIDDLVGHITRLFADLDIRKKPPATDAELAALTSTLGHSLPPLLRDWLCAINGENAGIVFATGWTFLCTDEIAMHHGFFADPDAALAPTSPFTPHHHRVRMPPSYREYTPFAADYLGNLLVIDHDPADPTYAGQVLFVSREQLGIHVVFPTFDALLTELRDSIANGNVTAADGVVRLSGPGGALRPWLIRARPFAARPWQPSAADRAGVAAMSAQWRSAAYVGQNDLLQTDAFTAQDLDLVYAVKLAPELLADIGTLGLFPNLSAVGIDADATPEALGAIANHQLRTLSVAATSAEGLRGIEAFGATHPTLTTLWVSSADQEAFDRICTIATLRDVTLSGSAIHDLSRLGNLEQLVKLNIHGTGLPDLSPAYAHPTLRDLSVYLTLNRT